MANTPYEITNLNEILEHLIKSYHRQAYAIEALWLKAGLSKDELQQVMNKADLDRDRERLKQLLNKPK